MHPPISLHFDLSSSSSSWLRFSSPQYQTMSSTATSLVPWAGPHHTRRNRPPPVRRRSLSTVTTTTSNASHAGVTLAEWEVASISELHSSQAPSPIDFEAAFKPYVRLRSQSLINSSSNMPRFRRPPAARGDRVVADSTSNLPLYPRRLSTLPPLPDQKEEEPDKSRKFGMKGLLSTITSRLDPKESSSRRRESALKLTVIDSLLTRFFPYIIASTTSGESDYTLVPPVRPQIDQGRPLSFTYDSASRRITGLEDWEIHFPNELQDPFAGLEVSVTEMAQITSLSSAYDIYKLLSRRIVRKLESLASTAKTQIPKAFKRTSASSFRY